MPQLSEAVQDDAKKSYVVVHTSELNVVPTQSRFRSTAFSSIATERSRPSHTKELLTVGLPQWLSDMIAATLCYVLAYSVVVWLGRPINHFPEFVATNLLSLSICLWLAGCYPGVGLAPAKELRKVVRGCLAASTGLMIGLLAINNAITPYLQMIVLATLLAVVCLPLARCFTKDWMRKRNLAVPFYFVGNRQDVMDVHQDMTRFSWTMLNPIGRFNLSNRSVETVRIATESDWSSKIDEEVPLLGTVNDILSPGKATQVNWLFFVGDPSDSASAAYVERLERIFPHVVWVAPRAAITASATSVLNCGLAVGIRSEQSLLLLGPRVQKRLLDIALSASMLVVLLPVFVAIALLVRMTSRGPALVRISRIGKNGKAFHAWKFRSMVPNASEVLNKYLQANPTLRMEWERDHKLKDDPRVTAVGRVLRKTSLDELPQLWNVLMGQMSLVGPRPIVDEEIVKYGDIYQDYLSVRPGITGLWQVSGRNNTTYPERVTMDRYYVQNWSVWLDLYILLRTVKTVAMCEGAY